MRTTLSLDDDVAAALKRRQADLGKSWKELVNDLLRAGLALSERRASETRQVPRTSSVRLGRPTLGDLSNVHEVLSLTEGDSRAR